MPSPDYLDEQSLTGIVRYLFSRREAILANWRVACEKDPALAKIILLSREEFNNLLPVILNILEQRLLGEPVEADLAATAQEHGLHRWQKTHALMETIRELNYLTQTLYSELKLFTELYADVGKTVLMHVHDQISLLMQETIYGSVQKYDELQRLQASGRAATLQHAVDQMHQLALHRNEMLRTSSHDLRGSIGIVSSAASLLQMDGLTEQERQQFLDMMSRSLTNVHAILTDLMDLSRLEAGQETLQIEPIDAAQLLSEAVAGAQPMATQKSIILRSDGVPTLNVKTDRIKLRRIIQNLLVYALKCTPCIPEHPAIVSVSWSAEGDYRWAFSIQDSGPGIRDDVTGIFSEHLRPTAESIGVTTPDEAEPSVALPGDLPTIPDTDDFARLSDQSLKSGGVGLQVVKRLCELLDASMDIESKKGRGTIYRIRLPVHHSG